MVYRISEASARQKRKKYIKRHKRQRRMGDIIHADNEGGKVSKEFGGSFPRLFPDVRKPTNQAGDRLTKKLSGNAPQNGAKEM